jgi:hypothetical protein
MGTVWEQPWQRALELVRGRAAQQSRAAMAPLLKRVCALTNANGKPLQFGVDDLNEVLAYMRKRAPIIVHFPPQYAELFVADTHYRYPFRFQICFRNDCFIDMC